MEFEQEMDDSFYDPLDPPEMLPGWGRNTNNYNLCIHCDAEVHVDYKCNCRKAKEDRNEAV
jgi:hypothetical protein